MDRAHAIALIERYYTAFNAGDRSAMLDCLSDAVVHDINQGTREGGREAFAAFLERMHRCYRECLQDIRIAATDDGRWAAAEYVVHGEYLQQDEGLPPAHGQRYVLAGGAFFDLADGRITRVTNYYNLGDWIAQVGAGT